MDYEYKTTDETTNTELTTNDDMELYAIVHD
jgi:hypothetical protein